MSYQITYYGHGTLGLKINQYQIIIDPYFTNNPATNTSPDEVNPDYLLITHGHGDHVGDAVEIANRTGAKVIANAEIARWMGAKGAEVFPQHIGGGHDYPFGYVKLTQAVHGSSMPDGSYGGMPGGFLITTPTEEKVYFAGDTGLFAGMALIGEEGIHLAVLPIGDNYTMGPDDALRAVKLIQPKYVIPAHYNTWPLIAQDPEAWKKRVESETDTFVHIMDPDASRDY
ncbi:MAG: metal-dependent hydrolase [Anaerolineales bacterium]|nr:MAG: metal-dependent hydrolase [Anaerolineales bacterium]